MATQNAKKQAPARSKSPAKSAAKKAPKRTSKTLSSRPARQAAKKAATKRASRRSAASDASPASSPKPLVGSVAWRDLTVKNADAVCAFYSKVVGWKVLPIDMGGYSDYCMIPPASEMPEAGVCHKRGVNADLPSQWLMYVVVADLRSALDQCKKLGGKQLTEIRPQGTSRFAVIKDPAGAMLGLYEIG
jgi:predicted enzyme related to lactoylglutathione lyase